MSDKKISRLVTALKWLLWLTALLQVDGIIVFFVTNENLYLEIGGEIWKQAILDFSLLDQIVIAIILAVPTIVLLWGLYQLLKLCGYYAKGIFFVLETNLCFKNFAKSLIIMAILETAVTPLLISYLWVQESIPAIPDITWLFVIDNIEIPLLAFGVLIFLISKIMEIAIAQNDELELTV